MRRLPTFLFFGAWLSGTLLSQTVISTFAGLEWVFLADGRPASQAPISGDLSLAAGPQGVLYICDRPQNMVFRVGADGFLRILAGNGMTGFSGDGGPAVAATLNTPSGIAVDPAGNIYIADTGNARIRRISPDGIIRTIAGGVPGFGGDGGPASAAMLQGPRILKFDSQGNLFLIDSVNFRVRRIAADGTITTYAGNGRNVSSGDGGQATNASFQGLNDIAFDLQGNLFVTEFAGHRIRKVAPDGIITTFAGNGVAGYSGDGGPAVNAALRGPYGIAVDPQGNVFFGDFNNARIRRVSTAGVISTVAGNGILASAGDGGPASSASLTGPLGLVFDSSGALLFAELPTGRVRRIANDLISAVAGSGGYRLFNNGSPAAGIYFGGPSAVAVDALGNTYVSDSTDQAIFRINPARIASLVMGRKDNVCRVPPATPMPSLQAGLCSAAGFQSLPNGTLLITEAGNKRVRLLRADGTVSSLAGAGNSLTFDTFAGDGGPATQALFANPNHAIQDDAGNIFIADTNNHRIRKVTPDGVIDTFAGTGAPGFAGDGGPAAQAMLNFPSGLALDSAGNLYIADRNNHRLRRINSAGIISTFAGTGTAGFAGDGGPAAQARFSLPSRMAFDSAGNIFIADRNNHRIRKIAPDGTISTAAGIGRPTFSGDGGPPTEAGLSSPRDVTVDSLGNLYIADTGNFRIRIVQPASTFGASDPCGYAISARSANFSANGGTRALQVAANAGCSWVVADAPPWMAVSAGASGSGPGTVVYQVAPNPDSTPRSAAVIIAGQRFILRQAGSPPLLVDPDGVSLAFPLGGRPASRTLSISTLGASSLVFSATASSLGGSWLSVSPASGSASAAQPASLLLTINPQNLTPGTYAGQVDLFVGSTGEQRTIPVSISVSRTAQNLLLSQTGLFFRAVAGSPSALAQPLSVINSGSGAMPWTARTSATSGGNWLSATPASGTSLAGQPPPSLTVTANPAGLPVGDYYGSVDITAPDAANSIQSASVVLQILPAGTILRPLLDSAGLVFAGPPGGANPAPQSVRLQNPLSSPVPFTAALSFTNGDGWVALAPSSGSVAAGASTALTLTPNTRGLAAGVYRAAVTVTFSGQSETGRVDILLIVASDAGLSSAKNENPHAGACRPTRLLPLFQLPEPSFDTTVGWPKSVVVKINDDCGDPLTGGSVSVGFSNGDPPLALSHVERGVWSATWPARNQIQRVTLTTRALDTAGLLAGSIQQDGGVTPNPNPPIISPGGITDAASFRGGQPVAPGSLVSIFGGRLSDEFRVADSLPLATLMAGTQAFLGGRPLPLVFTSDGQVNALIPYELEQNTTHQLILRRSARLSVPEPVLVSSSQPAVFTVDGSGSGQGHIYKFNAAGAPVLADGANPAARGDVIVVYATGLGPVTPESRAGSTAPSSPLSQTANPVSVILGGAEAEVIFAGLTPGFTGLYQVNIIVPARAPTGPDVPVTVTVAGRSSSPVSIGVVATSGEQNFGAEPQLP